MNFEAATVHQEDEVIDGESVSEIVAASGE
jgi:hypothetical protein